MCEGTVGGCTRQQGEGKRQSNIRGVKGNGDQTGKGKGSNVKKSIGCFDFRCISEAREEPRAG